MMATAGAMGIAIRAHVTRNGAAHTRGVTVARATSAARLDLIVIRVVGEGGSAAMVAIARRTRLVFTIATMHKLPGGF